MPPKNRVADNGGNGPSAPPSESEGRAASDKIKAKKRRPQAEVDAEKLVNARKLVADNSKMSDGENAQLLSTTKAVVSAVPMSMNLMAEKLNQIYAVPLADLAPEGVSFSFSKGEMELVGVTVEQVLERVTPEWIEKYGLTIVLILFGVNIFMPRLTMMYRFWGHDHDKWMLRKAAFERGEDPDAKPAPAPNTA